jgi:DNA gyrase subunit B
MNKNYNAESIELLTGLAAVRKRVDMYMGASTGKYSPALFRMFREILDNSLDEYLIGVNYETHIFYNTKTNEIAVIDNGRGVPTDINSKTKTSALTLVFSELHSSGKFNKDSYKVSSGKNGVGASCTNAISEYFYAYSNNNASHQWNCQKFKEGKIDGPVSVSLPPKEYKKLVKKTGTIVIFKPDKKIFKDGIDTDVNRLRKELKDIRYLCPKLHLHLHIDDSDEEFYSEEGLIELVKTDKDTKPIFSFGSENIDVALNFTNKEGFSFKSFVNICNTDMGGTHLNGLKKAICEIAKSKSKQKISNEDILEGIVGAIHYKMAEPQYQSQTKNELTSIEAEADVINIITPPLEKFFRKNKEILENIIKYAEKMLLEKQRMKASKDLLKGISKLNTAAKYISDKFLDANRRKFKNSSDLELFIVEGNSAGGHFKIARDGNQAALKLRGKLINAEKASAEELFGKANAKNDDAKGNREIKDLVAALGCGIQENYDENKLRFGRVIILTDADTDGSHIANLILAFFINYMPDLIKNGHVFRVDAPLFIAKANSQRAYGKTRAEIDNKMHKLGIKKYNVLRAKGWGEVSAEEMSELCLSPKTRKLIKIDYDKDINKSLSQTMGDDIQYRKEMMGIV